MPRLGCSPGYACGRAGRNLGRAVVFLVGLCSLVRLQFLSSHAPDKLVRALVPAGGPWEGLIGPHGARPYGLVRVRLQ